MDCDLLDFDLVKKIGSGKYGEVFLAKNYNRDYPKKIVVKVISKDFLDKSSIDPSKEIEILQKLDSNFVVKFYNDLEDSKYIYHLLEYCPRGDLYDRLTRGRLYFDEGYCFFRQIGYAIQYLHFSKIIHRDIKPENILLDKLNNIKLCDFGLSKEFKEGQTFNDTAGTIFYMAPEIVLRKDHDKSVDIWSLGVVFYEMLVGRPPFYAENDKDILHEIAMCDVYYPLFIPLKAKQILSSILLYEPEKRLTIDEICSLI